MLPSRANFIFSVGVCCLLHTSAAFQTASLFSSFSSPVRSPSYAGYDTALSMGLRDFIKKKVLKRKPAVEVVTPVSEDDAEESSAPPVRSYIPDQDENLNDEDLPPFYHEETAQERIQRVKSGKMTDEEKKAFLRTALSDKGTPSSRAPLRQPLPREDKAKKNKFTASASPFPKDTLLRNFARGKRDGDDNPDDIIESAKKNWKDGITQEEQKKKKEYLKMVTDPNRFHTYKSAVGNDAAIELPDEAPVEEEEVVEEVDSSIPDLGSRLEAHAHEMEKAAKVKQEQQEKQRQEREKRELERRKVIEAERQRQAAEQAKRELEAKAALREKEELAARKAEEKRRVEMARLKELEAAQDAYWAEKIAKEKAAKGEGASEKVEKPVLRETRIQKQLEETQKAIDEEILASEKPAETDKAPMRHKREAASASFRKEQEKQHNAIDRQKDEQLARLKALNSPLPSPRGAAPPAAALPVKAPPAKAPPAPAPPPKRNYLAPDDQDVAAAPMPSLREMTRKRETPNSPPAPAPAANFFGRPKKKEDVPPKLAPKKQVVRQALPLGDDEDDFDVFARNGPNQSMSIGDAMKAAGSETGSGDQSERSRKWGVDMSRINKSLEEEEKRNGKK